MQMHKEDYYSAEEEFLYKDEYSYSNGSMHIMTPSVEHCVPKVDCNSSYTGGSHLDKKGHMAMSSEMKYGEERKHEGWGSAKSEHYGQGGKMPHEGDQGHFGHHKEGMGMGMGMGMKQHGGGGYGGGQGHYGHHGEGVEHGGGYGGNHGHFGTHKEEKHGGGYGGRQGYFGHEKEGMGMGMKQYGGGYGGGYDHYEEGMKQYGGGYGGGYGHYEEGMKQYGGGYGGHQGYFGHQGGGVKHGGYGAHQGQYCPPQKFAVWEFKSIAD